MITLANDTQTIGKGIDLARSRPSLPLTSVLYVLLILLLILLKEERN